MNYQAYSTALLEQVNLHSRQLDMLGNKSSPLNQVEKTAIERSLQIIVEAAIGCSKQLARKLNLIDRTDAYQNIEQAASECGVDQDWLPQLKGAVGMRNAIVHDYLNLNWQLIEDVLKTHKYRIVARFVRLVCTKLVEPKIETWE
ncbi:MAG: hypothetical protein DRR42_23050 [Gammaproteobacteria bacterium]|nr:MAG: hypothetical protein DRR42_23050 [Gammaproteobacteria bacterium]